MGMNNKRFSQEQIMEALRQLETGKSVEEICQDYGIKPERLMRWQEKEKEMEAFRQHYMMNKEEENNQLREKIKDLESQIEMARNILKRI